MGVPCLTLFALMPARDPSYFSTSTITFIEKIPLVAVFGDSCTSGTSCNSTPEYTSHFQEELRIERSRFVDPSAAEVVFLGDRNDLQGHLWAARSRRTAATRQAPPAKLIVVGPPWVTNFRPRCCRKPGRAPPGDPVSRWHVRRPYQRPIVAWARNVMDPNHEHPHERGHEVGAQKIEPVIADRLTSG
jgi:hypothetical protein